MTVSCRCCAVSALGPRSTLTPGGIRRSGISAGVTAPPMSGGMSIRLAKLGSTCADLAPTIIPPGEHRRGPRLRAFTPWICAESPTARLPRSQDCRSLHRQRRSSHDLRVRIHAAHAIRVRSAAEGFWHRWHVRHVRCGQLDRQRLATRRPVASMRSGFLRAHRFARSLASASSRYMLSRPTGASSWRVRRSNPQTAASCRVWPVYGVTKVGSGAPHAGAAAMNAAVIPSPDFSRYPVETRTALPFECPFIEVSNLDERAGNA